MMPRRSVGIVAEAVAARMAKACSRTAMPAALATSDYGTASPSLFTAHEEGQDGCMCIADETRADRFLKAPYSLHGS